MLLGYIYTRGVCPLQDYYLSQFRPGIVQQPVSRTTLLLFMETIGQSHIVRFKAETILITFHLPSSNRGSIELKVTIIIYLIINYRGGGQANRETRLKVKDIGL